MHGAYNVKLSTQCTYFGFFAANSNRTADIYLYSYSSTFPHNPQRNCSVRREPGRAYLFRMDIIQCLALSTAVTHPFPHHYHLELLGSQDLASDLATESDGSAPDRGCTWHLNIFL